MYLQIVTESCTVICLANGWGIIEKHIIDITNHMAYSGCWQDVFTSKALYEIHKASAGIPRMINRICEKALMYAFQNQKRLIDDYMIKFVVEHKMLGSVAP